MRTAIYNGTERILRPILFQPMLMLKNIANEKTETRRSRGLKEYNQQPNDWTFSELKNKAGSFTAIHTKSKQLTRTIKAPVNAGDILWARESYMALNDSVGQVFNYLAQDINSNIKGWKPSVHMPFEACRFFAEVKEVSLERIQSITNYSAIAEGVAQEADGWKDYQYGRILKYPIDSFSSLIKSISGESVWNKNHWVWVLKYVQIEKDKINFQ